MKTLKQQPLFIGLVLALACSISSIALAADITGSWRTIDDKTGAAKSIITIEKTANGTYSGTIVKILPRAGYTPKKYCVNCPAPFTDKPIEGLNVLWGLVQDSDGAYDNGKIIDPLSGKIYRAKATLGSEGKTLTVRGYIGVSMFGRSQVWQRVSEEQIVIPK